MSARGLLNLVLNVVWLVLAGLLHFIAWGLITVLLAVLIVTIPFAIQTGKIAIFGLWPFGRTLIKRESAGAPSLVGNIVWVVLFGWWLALLNLIQAVALALSVVGIPLALGNLKMIPVSLWPFGREIVPVESGEPAAHAVTIGAR